MGASARIVVVGELLADVTAGAPPGHGVPRPLVARPGGGPANTAIGLARLGVATAFVHGSSRRGAGPWLAAHLTGEGVDTSLSVPTDRMPTLAWVELDEAGRASYGFYGADTADWHLTADDLPDPAAIGAAAVHTGSLAAATPPGAAVIAAWTAGLRAAGTVLVSYDPNVRASGVDGAPTDPVAVEAMRRSAHVVKISDDDLAQLHPGVAPLDAAAAWLDDGPELVVVTGGPDSVVALRRGCRPVTVTPPATVVVDTVGAGDAFAAGLLAWFDQRGCLAPGGPGSLADSELADALRTAATVAAVTCGRPGADPPTLTEVAEAPWPAPPGPRPPCS